MTCMHKPAREVSTLAQLQAVQDPGLQRQQVKQAAPSQQLLPSFPGPAPPQQHPRTCSRGSPPLMVMPPVVPCPVRYGFTRSSFLARSLLLVRLPGRGRRGGRPGGRVSMAAPGRVGGSAGAPQGAGGGRECGS